jgi:group I intron endonuclease
MFYTVYKITNIKNNMVYVGVHKTLDLNDNYFGSGQYLRAAIKKYGISIFTKKILAVFDTPEEMFNMERKIVTEEFVKSKNTYNLGIGGSGGNRVGKDHHTHSLSNMTSMSEKAKASWNDVTSRGERVKKLATRNSKLHKIGILKRPDWTGRKHKESTKQKISEKNSKNRTGEANHRFGKCWITDGTINRSVCKEAELPDGWRYGRVMKTNIVDNTK